MFPRGASGTKSPLDVWFHSSMLRPRDVVMLGEGEVGLGLGLDLGAQCSPDVCSSTSALIPAVLSFLEHPVCSPLVSLLPCGAKGSWNRS